MSIVWAEAQFKNIFFFWEHHFTAACPSRLWLYMPDRPICGFYFNIRHFMFSCIFPCIEFLPLVQYKLLGHWWRRRREGGGKCKLGGQQVVLCQHDRWQRVMGVELMGWEEFWVMLLMPYGLDRAQRSWQNRWEGPEHTDELTRGGQVCEGRALGKNRSTGEGKGHDASEGREGGDPRALGIYHQDNVEV